MFNNIVGDVNFDWWVGVVEDREDPKKLGRVRVRIIGRHTKDKQEIPTDVLPWALPLMPNTSASTSGIGLTPNLVEGSWVIGFHLDGIMSQEPVILGSILGFNTKEMDKKDGFTDPNDKYPLEKDPIGKDRTKESDVNRLARSEKIDETIVKQKKDNLEKEVKYPNGQWDEPETKADKAKYPFNQVQETECGHIVEYDSTEGNERIHEWHKSGTFKEIYPDGQVVQKIVGKDYEIYEKDRNIYVKGDLNITVDGSLQIKVKKDIVIHNDGKWELKTEKKHETSAERIDFNKDK